MTKGLVEGDEGIEIRPVEKEPTPLDEQFTEQAPASTPTEEFKEIIGVLKETEERAEENPWTRPKQNN